MSYLTASGQQAARTLPLTWGLLVISVSVIVIVCVLIGVALAKRRDNDGGEVVLGQNGRAARWVYIGVGLSTFVLTIALVWTVRVLANVNSPLATAALTVEVSGQQWWWKARYLSDDPSRVVTTANEIHIPAGKPVRIELIGTDVIHSFWIPSLAGKTDAVPGQRNIAWIEADKPGRYVGQCAEFCGLQHAHMAIEVVADAPADFERWLEAQRQPAAVASSDELARGRGELEFRCGACHTVRGTMAGGTVAPDLTHLMSRRTIAAGALENTPSNLAAWIANPQAIKPGNRMPMLQLSGQEIGDIDAYLATLQ